MDGSNPVDAGDGHVLLGSTGLDTIGGSDGANPVDVGVELSRHHCGDGGRGQCCFEEEFRKAKIFIFAKNATC